MILKYKDFKMLSKDDMKQIVGGNAPLGTCQAKVSVVGGGYTVFAGLSASEAQNQAGMVNWCCESCATASWAI